MEEGWRSPGYPSISRCTAVNRQLTHSTKTEMYSCSYHVKQSVWISFVFGWEFSLCKVLYVDSCAREYWILIEDQSFSGSHDLHGSSPSPFPLSRQEAQPATHRKADCRGEERGWGGAKSYDDEKAWSPANHSILSTPEYPHRFALYCSNFILKDRQKIE